MLELRAAHAIDPAQVEAVELESSRSPTTSSAAARRGQDEIRTKEEADHTLPYMLAVALLDGQVLPAQYGRSGSRGRTSRRCCARSRPPGRGPDRSLPRRARLPAARAPRRRRGARHREGRLRGLPDAADALGARRREVRPPRRADAGAALAGEIAETVRGARRRSPRDLTALLDARPARDRRRRRPDMQQKQRAGVRIPPRQRAAGKPRTRGLTEIRGPYYAVVGPALPAATSSRRWATTSTASSTPAGRSR